MLHVTPAQIAFCGCTQDVMHIAGEEVGFDIHSRPFFVATKECFTHRNGNNREAEGLFHHFVHGETHPVDGDRPFGRDKGDEFGIDADDDIKAVPVIGDGGYGTDRIDVPLDDVPLKPLTHLHSRFDVDFSAEFFSGDMGKSFGGEFDAESVTLNAHDGETRPIDRNRITELRFMLRFKRETVSAKAFHVCHFTNQSCKHNAPLLKYNFTLFLQTLNDGFGFFMTVIGSFSTPFERFIMIGIAS